MDDYNNEIKELVKDLTFEENLTFALTCINRVKHFPKYLLNSDTYAIQYIEEIHDIPRKNIIPILDEIVNKININPLEIKNNEIIEKIEVLDKLCVHSDEDGSIENSLFLNYLIILHYTLMYIKEKKYENIYWCSNNTIEMVDTMEYNRFCKKNKSCNDKEIYDYLDIIGKNEVEKQKEIIETIKRNQITLNEYIERNMIDFEIIEEK